MVREVILGSAILFALAGCDDAPPPPPATESGETAPTTAPARSLTDEISQGVEQGTRELEDLTRRAATQGRELYEDAKPHLKSATQEIRKATTQARDVIGDQVQQLTAATTRAAATSLSEINRRVDLSLRYVRERRLELADRTLATVESHGEQLTAATKARVETVREMIDAAIQARNARNALRDSPAASEPLLPEQP